MAQRKINLLLVAASVAGGLLASYTGEIMLAAWQGKVPNVWLMGMYFGQFALLVGVLCLAAELISPVLNGRSWRNRYTGTSWKMLIPGTLVLLFLTGSIFQFIYGLNVGGGRPPEDILMLMDVSESMKETDPDKHSVEAAKTLIQKMDAQKRAAVLAFNDEAQVIQPLTEVRDEAAKAQIIQKLDSFATPQGGTNISAALEAAMKHMEDTNSEKRNSMLILISDGYSEMNVEAALAPYKKDGITISTVGMNTKLDPRGAALLQTIASETGGSYYNVSRAQDLSPVFEKIYYEQQDRYLIGERAGSAKNSTYYAVLRILLLAGIGALIGLSLGIVFDNRYLARSFCIGGVVAGLLAGGILEIGLRSPDIPGYPVRLLADVVLAAVLTLFTMIVPLRDTNTPHEQRRIYGKKSGSASAFGSGQSNSQGF